MLKVKWLLAIKLVSAGIGSRWDSNVAPTVAKTGIKTVLFFPFKSSESKNN